MNPIKLVSESYFVDYLSIEKICLDKYVMFIVYNNINLYMCTIDNCLNLSSFINIPFNIKIYSCKFFYNFSNNTLMNSLHFNNINSSCDIICIIGKLLNSNNNEISNNIAKSKCDFVYCLYSLSNCKITLELSFKKPIVSYYSNINFILIKLTDEINVYSLENDKVILTINIFNSNSIQIDVSDNLILILDNLNKNSDNEYNDKTSECINFNMKLNYIRVLAFSDIYNLSDVNSIEINQLKGYKINIPYCESYNYIKCLSSNICLFGSLKEGVFYLINIYQQNLNYKLSLPELIKVNIDPNTAYLNADINNKFLVLTSFKKVYIFKLPNYHDKVFKTKEILENNLINNIIILEANLIDKFNFSSFYKTTHKYIASYISIMQSNITSFENIANSISNNSNNMFLTNLNGLQTIQLYILVNVVFSDNNIYLELCLLSNKVNKYKEEKYNIGDMLKIKAFNKKIINTNVKESIVCSYNKVIEFGLLHNYESDLLSNDKFNILINIENISLRSNFNSSSRKRSSIRNNYNTTSSINTNKDYNSNNKNNHINSKNGFNKISFEVSLYIISNKITVNKNFDLNAYECYLIEDSNLSTFYNTYNSYISKKQEIKSEYSNVLFKNTNSDLYRTNNSFNISFVDNYISNTLCPKMLINTNLMSIENNNNNNNNNNNFYLSKDNILKESIQEALKLEFNSNIKNVTIDNKNIFEIKDDYYK